MSNTKVINVAGVLFVGFLFVSECRSRDISENIFEDDNLNLKDDLGHHSFVNKSSNWTPEMGPMINLPVEQCETKDALNQMDFAQLLYLDMYPPCEETSKIGYCGIRRYQNFTLISKFVTKHRNQQFRVRVHLVDKLFGFETAVWPEFGACQPLFNITCPQEKGIVHSHVFSEIPKEIPPLSAIVRVRLVSVNENQEKNVAICRQIKLYVI